MKTFKYFLICIIVVGAFFFTSCEKEHVPEECYKIVPSTSISTSDLLGKEVQVQWATNDGRGGNFFSSVTQMRYLVNSSNTDSVLMAVINGEFFGTSGNFSQPNQPMFMLVFNKEKTEIYSVKAFISSEGMAWNGYSYAKFGVVEDTEKISISINGMSSPLDEGIYMCVQFLISK
jgi:hypothetical protein